MSIFLALLGKLVDHDSESWKDLPLATLVEVPWDSESTVSEEELLKLLKSDAP